MTERKVKEPQTDPFLERIIALEDRVDALEKLLKEARIMSE